MCKIYKKQKSGSFRWDIDQACTLVPADIVACSSQFEPSPDPLLEKIAEEVTEKYVFSDFQILIPIYLIWSLNAYGRNFQICFRPYLRQ